MKNLFTRDHIVWTLTFVASVLTFIAASTHLIPEPYTQTVQEVAAVLAFVSGKLGWSPLPTSERINP